MDQSGKTYEDFRSLGEVAAAGSLEQRTAAFWHQRLPLLTTSVTDPERLPPLEVRPQDLLRLPVLVSQGEVDLQHVDKLLAEEPADRSVCVRLDHLLDLCAHLTLISLGILGPRG